MTENRKEHRPKARLAKGFRDVGPDEIRGLRRMLATIQEVYESYGFEPVEQPFVEYTDALGKFLPDQDRPNAGVFSFQDDDEQWLSLRYDLTAPLARYVAENQQSLPTPYRSYRQGWVFRNEKPGPGRYRQFMQFDADTVGSASPAADAEVCMMAADTMEALGIPRGSYCLRVYNRKVIDGIFESIGLAGTENSSKRLIALRAIDKLDKFGIEGVKLLLGNGRKDESGDFAVGAKLEPKQIDKLTAFFVVAAAAEKALDNIGVPNSKHGATGSDLQQYESFRAEGIFGGIASFAATSPRGLEGMAELRQIWSAVSEAGYNDGRIRIDPSVVRGLEYYTGPVFECELLMETKDEEGRPVRFGSVGGGGRYDDLVARFTGQKVPATGFSIGVSRLYSALKLVGKAQSTDEPAPVVVLVMDKDRQGDYWRMVQQLREGGIRAEMYVGTAGMKAQMKYADKRGAPLVVIQGGDEKAKGEVQIKDLRLGSELASGIVSREEYASQRLAQVSVPEAEMADAVKKALGR
ncbi:MAG: histidine--tRNA ligase [Aestuariivirga sp.]